ncbi:Bcr/CflA family drug resistance efflux transporter (fragment) [Methylocella tundrae]|uniref:Bcr/CflA family drug resistance efflux transporter n=1 Tax=Methylocella tundrae TaxID=227605 RepID=A0A8B6MAQ2_METTU
MVIPRAVIRDLHTGIEAARLMSLVMLVLSVSPILAPLTGSALIAPFGWRAIFVAVTFVAALAFGLTALCLPETRPPEECVRFGLASAAAGFAQLLHHERFVALTFIGGFSLASFFVFLAGSSFIYIDHFGLTPRQFSVAFAVNAIGFIGSSQFAAPLAKRFGMVRVVIIAVFLYAFFALVLFGVTAAGVDSLAVLMALLFAIFACVGLVAPSAMVLALEEHGPVAGAASALAGTLQMLASGVVIVVVSMFFYENALPMAAAIALCSMVALALSFFTLGWPELVPQ